MFSKDNRYITRGINIEVPPILREALWRLVEMQIEQGLPMDSLQIFKLCGSWYNNEFVQKIEHIQEQPPRSAILHIKIKPEQIVNAKIYIIDSVSYSTMLFSYEY